MHKIAVYGTALFGHRTEISPDFSACGGRAFLDDCQGGKARILELQSSSILFLLFMFSFSKQQAGLFCGGIGRLAWGIYR